MKRYACLITLISAMAVWASVAWAGAGTLVFKGQVTTTKDMISLWDLVSPDSKLDSVIKDRLVKYHLTRSPGLGRVKKISASKIQTALKVAKLPKGVTTLIPKHVVISRDSQTLSRDEMIELYRQALLNHLAGRAGQVDIHDIQVSRDLLLPAGELSTQVDIKGSRMTGEVLAYLIVNVDGKTVSRVRISAYVDHFAPVVVAANGLRKGQIIQAKDLEVMELNLSEIRGHVAGDPNELVGMRTRGAVGLGQPVLLGRLERTPLIRRGDIVTMIVQFPGLFVRVKGKAEQTGYKDTRIRLINLATKKKVFGKVLNSGTVQVDI